MMFANPHREHGFFLSALAIVGLLSASSPIAAQSNPGSATPQPSDGQSERSAAGEADGKRTQDAPTGDDDKTSQAVSPAPPRKIAAASRELDAQTLRLRALGLSQGVVPPANGSHLGWALLTLPERLLETFFLPIGALVIVVERYRLPQRATDLLENDEGTIALRPKVKVSTGQGLGAGASLKLKSKFASQARLTLSGLFELDSDFEVGLETSMRVASLEGRKIELRLSYETEGGADFSGVGVGTSNANRRELGIDEARAGFDLDLSGRGAQEFTGLFTLSFLRQRLYAGTGTNPPLGEPGDSVTPPLGFDTTTNIVGLGLKALYDSRDTGARTSRGTLLEWTGTFRLDPANGSTNSFTQIATGAVFVPLFGRRRTLALSAGMGLAESVTQEDDIPFSGLVTIGRENFLRGYDKERFRVTRATWAGAEYRYPIWYMNIYPVVLTSRLFVDVGTEGNEFAELIESPIRYSVGAGLTLERYKSALGGIQLARSPEGLEFVFTAGGLL